MRHTILQTGCGWDPSNTSIVWPRLVMIIYAVLLSTTTHWPVHGIPCTCVHGDDQAHVYIRPLYNDVLQGT